MGHDDATVSYRTADAVSKWPFLTSRQFNFANDFKN